jgi:hypothetical protein
MLSDDQVKADIMYRLLRRDCWGARYLPIDTLVNWLGKKVRRDGHRVRRILRELVNDGHLLVHKRGTTVSLNPARSREIEEFIKRIE